VQIQDTRSCYVCDQAIKFFGHTNPSKATTMYGKSATIKVLNKSAGVSERLIFISAEVQCYNYSCRATNIFHYTIGEKTLEQRRVSPSFAD
jgi:hypothetical protein